MMRSGGGGEPTIQPSLTGSVLSAVGGAGGVAKAGAGGAGVWASAPVAARPVIKAVVMQDKARRA
jgi:hypothetical protein